jgi:hypothetical protein
MSKDVKDLEEALEVLKALRVVWVTINRIKNNLWDTGIAFFDKSHLRVAYYDEANNVLLIK